MVDFETSSSKLEVSKSNQWKITSFSKTIALQREPFLTMFYTINLSPLLVTKKGFMSIIILSNYQQCPLPLIGNSTRMFTRCNVFVHVVLHCPHCNDFAANISIKISIRSCKSLYFHPQIISLEGVAVSQSRTTSRSPPSQPNFMLCTVQNPPCVSSLKPQ